MPKKNSLLPFAEAFRKACEKIRTLIKSSTEFFFVLTDKVLEGSFTPYLPPFSSLPCVNMYGRFENASEPSNELLHSPNNAGRGKKPEMKKPKSCRIDGSSLYA